MRKTPFMQGVGSAATPIYMELVNKKKVFDLDDRLIVLFFSAMNYIEETFGFKMPKSEFYAPMRVNEFRRLLGHRGIMELRRIKHKYFADKFLRLYNIMKAFFEWGGNFSACGFGSEYLLTSKYNNVFEHMIDKLVGDDLPSKMAHLKNQKDGKEVDHLYRAQQLVFADESQKIWFIGDSKYYKDSNDITGESLYKQFTYAKNVIQYNIKDLLEFEGKEENKDKPYGGLRYRDKVTEGYTVTPNFFIRGEVPALESPNQFDEKYFRNNPAADASDLIRKVDDASANLWENRNRQFQNRLFDRDTLLLQVYNVNFLYVLKAFTAKGSGLRTEFKRTARKKFRRNFLKLLDEKYTFWAVYPRKESLDNFVTNNFRKLQGKMFRRDESDNFIILALEKGADKNPEILTDVKKVADLMWVAVEKFIDGSDVNCLEVREVVDGQWSDENYGFYLKKEIFEERVLNNTTLPKKLVVKSQDGNAVIRESLLNGGVIPDYSPNGEYGDVDCYFLPCK